MSKKTAKVTLKSVEDYVSLMNGIFNLTDKEIKVISSFIREQKRREKSDKKGFPHLFHHTVKREISRREFGKPGHHWLNAYVMKLRDKGALIRTNDPGEKEGKYKINPGLVPSGEDRIVIKINWDLKHEQEGQSRLGEAVQGNSQGNGNAKRKGGGDS